MKVSRISLCVFCVIILALTSVSKVARADQASTIHLTDKGKTSYKIVQPADPSEQDKFAVEGLAKYLNQITDATFQVIPPEQVRAGDRYIFVGISDVVRARLGGGDPLDDLQLQDFVARTKGEDIFLYGEGIYGNVYAVREFLQNSLGWRWFSVYAQPVMPYTPTVTLEPFNHHKGYAYKYRYVSLHAPDKNARAFYLWHGVNMNWRSRTGDGTNYPAAGVNLLQNSFHSAFAYIPPTPDARNADLFSWQDKKDYFKTNPEFFTLNQQGKHVATQLDYANPELRKALTRNVLRGIAYDKKNGEKNICVSLVAQDVPGQFSYSAEAQALVKKYGTPAGPMLDYVLELAKLLEQKHPDAIIKFLAYRRDQTQLPPKWLPDGQTMLPKNMIVSFAPIEDAYLADWWNNQRADDAQTFEDLLAWSKISHHTWGWFYQGYGKNGGFMPVATPTRTINNLRLMHYAGVTGIRLDDGVATISRDEFNELQRYLIFHLLQDPDIDTKQLIKEFTDWCYGGAASVMRTYINELDAASIKATPPAWMRYHARYTDDAEFPYLTLENIYRWQKDFDEMVKLTAAQPQQQERVLVERRAVDTAVLWKWFPLQEKYPKYFTDYNAFAERIRNNTHWRKEEREGVLNRFLFKVKAGKTPPPLPKELSAYDVSQSRQIVPIRHHNSDSYVADPEAASGYTAPVHDPDLPFSYGAYDASAQKFLHNLKLEEKQIEPGKYRLYEVGPITLTPGVRAFFGHSWQTNIELGHWFYKPDEDPNWLMYVSLKFTGPKYGGQGKDNEVYCDRVILVRPKAPL